MARPNPFYRQTANTRNCWGYRFELTDDHLNTHECEPLRRSYDVLGEQVLDRLNTLSPPPNKELPRNSTRHQAAVRKDGTFPVESNEEPPKLPSRDLYSILKDNKDDDELLGRFWSEVNAVPDWVDWEQIRRGQDAFYRYSGANMAGLAYQSLLGGMGAARVVETLARTGGFSTKVAKRRIYETSQHILQCTKSLESMQPGGDGWISTIRVRLLHAAVRQRILSMEAAKPGYYNVEAWGIPINDLDSMGTIATFSASLIWVSLPRQGIYMRRQEIEDTIALWRYIAYVIGCPTDRFETPGKARALIESLLLYEVNPSETSKIMANNVIKSLAGQPPGFASADFLVASARWMNGNELCDKLGLPRPGIYYSMLMAGQCLFFSFFAYTYRSIPSWDKSKIEWLRDVLYKFVVKSEMGLGGESSFEFTYVPQYSTITEMGKSEDGDNAVSTIERRNLRSLLVGVGVAGFACWAAVYGATGMVRALY